MTEVTVISFDRPANAEQPPAFDALTLPKLLDAVGERDLVRLRAAVEKFGADSFDDRAGAVDEAITAAKGVGAPAFWILLEAAKSNDPEIAYRARLAIDGSGVHEPFLLQYQEKVETLQKLLKASDENGRLSSDEILSLSAKANDIARGIGTSQLETLRFLCDNFPRAVTPPGKNALNLGPLIEKDRSPVETDVPWKDQVPVLIGLNALSSLKPTDDEARQTAKEIVSRFMEKYPDAFAAYGKAFARVITNFQLTEDPGIRRGWQKLGLDEKPLERERE